jgi:nitrite reductase (NADH) small subunit
VAPTLLGAHGSVKARYDRDDRLPVDRPVIMGAMSRLVRIASPGEIPVGQGKAVEIDGLLLAVFNAGGLYHAIDGFCPHEGGPLADGALLGDSVVCPWHGFDFDVRTGACSVAPDLAVTVYPVRVTGSDVVVELP